jgi:hypothetical protein
MALEPPKEEVIFGVSGEFCEASGPTSLMPGKYLQAA